MIGGRAWPNVIFDDKKYDYTFAIWSNSTLGLISYWWHSSRQQPGRAVVSFRALETLPILDLRSLSDDQHTIAEQIFEQFRVREFEPVYISDADRNRAELDRAVICDLLGFDQKTLDAVRLLARKWCAEPSVHGGKERPNWAEKRI